MKVKAFRYDQETGASGFSEYDLPFGFQSGYTVITIVRYIQENLDPTLSFFSHCVCSRGICGRCVMKVNGKSQLACAYVPDTNDLTIEPKNPQHFKDLVVKERDK